MKPFEPSIDWGRALPDSLVWIAQAWSISAVCLLLVLVALRYATPWGRQFWQITGAYFTGPDRIRAWSMLGALLLSVVSAVRLSVLFSYQIKDQFNGLQVALGGFGAHDDLIAQTGVRGFWFALGIFALISALHVARSMLDIYLTQHFILGWRVWLTDRLTDDWLAGRAYYRGRFIDATIDNPDQRIQQDIDVFTTGAGATPNAPSHSSADILLLGAVQAVLSVMSFAAILWNLSGPLTLLGLTLPRAMFWIVIGYVLTASLIAFWLGRPLIRLSFRNELTNAAFRYALVRLRDAAEAVALYRGEDAERRQLRARLAPIVENYLRFVNRTIVFKGWNMSMSQVIIPLPWVVQAPRLFTGQINLGDVGQSAGAFGNIADSLSFFRNHYADFTSYRAAIIRLHGLVTADEQGRRLPAVAAVAGDDVAIEDVEVRSPGGDQLIENLDLRLSAGDALVVTGSSGSGKTTLLRSLAQLWPYASGTFRRPGPGHQTMFCSQLPYVPLGDLRAVVCYPAAAEDISDQLLREVLVRVMLPHLVDRLDEEQDWAKVLSPGEQQRVAFARVLLTRPKAVFLDEATSALDEGLELTLYRLLRTELPDTIVVSISHRPTVEPHHDQRLELLGAGRWRLGPV